MRAEEQSGGIPANCVRIRIEIEQGKRVEK
jgi:hypothetical protein